VPGFKRSAQLIAANGERGSWQFLHHQVALHELSRILDRRSCIESYFDGTLSSAQRRILDRAYVEDF
jgi:hypothetical protein